MARSLDEKVYTEGDRSSAGGVVSTVDPDKLDGGTDSAASMYALAENAYPGSSGRWVKRRGYESIFARTGETPPNPIAMRRFAGGVLVWYDDGSLYHVPFGDDPVLVKAGAFTPGDTFAHEEWDNKVFWSDGSTGLWQLERSGTAEAATLTLTFGADDLVLTAVNEGSDGNDITLALVDPAAANASLAVSLTGTAVTVTLATDGDSLITSTIADVVTAINEDVAASALVTAAGTAVTLVTATAATNLAGGISLYDFIVTLATSAHSFTYLAKRTASERLFGVDAEDRTLIRYSDTFDPTTWGGLSVLAPGGEFVALVEVGRVMVLAQVDKMYRIDGTDPETWELVSIGAEGIGCIAPESIKEVEGIVIYYSPRGLAFFDGAKARPLSDAVFDPNDSSRSLLPAEMAVARRVFTVVTQDHVLVFYPATQATTGANRAMAYNFRRNTWGGPYIFGFQATCGDCELDADGAGRNVHLGTNTGDVVREFAGYTDLGAAYTMKVRTRDYHFGTITLDKVYREVRVAYEVGNVPVVDPEQDSPASSATVRLICEDEAGARSGAERTFSLPGAQADVIKMAVRAGIRARQAAVQIEHAGNAFFELAEEQVDAFFCRAR